MLPLPITVTLPVRARGLYTRAVKIQQSRELSAPCRFSRTAEWWPPAAMAAKGRLQPVVLNSAPPGRTRDGLAALTGVSAAKQSAILPFTLAPYAAGSAQRRLIGEAGNGWVQPAVQNCARPGGHAIGSPRSPAPLHAVLLGWAAKNSKPWQASAHSEDRLVWKCLARSLERQGRQRIRVMPIVRLLLWTLSMEPSSSSVE